VSSCRGAIYTYNADTDLYLIIGGWFRIRSVIKLETNNKQYNNSKFITAQLEDQEIVKIIS